MLPLPDKPALPSALKSRPPTTSLLPPTSASRAAQGSRKRVQWASEVASVALIENRPQLAEMWDTGPDAAEMPSQLLTPSPTPVSLCLGLYSWGRSMHCAFPPRVYYVSCLTSVFFFAEWHS